MVEELRKALEPFNYIVQRNWHDLPQLDAEHPDLDLFVSEEDYADALLICQQYPWVDLRHPSDGYYPPEIADMLLTDVRYYKDFPIPNKLAYFLSLYYHNQVHKKNDPYKYELIKAFLDWAKPTRPDDPGVNFYGDT